MTTPTISLTDLTSSPLSGSGEGIFDVLILKVHKELEQQFVKGYLKGAEYAQVYVSSLNTVMAQSMQFLLSRDKLNIELQLLELQKEAQRLANEKLQLEKDILVLQKGIIELEKTQASVKIELMELEKITVGKQQIGIDKANLRLDKETILLEKQALTEEQKKLNMAQELLQIQAQKDLLIQQKINLILESDKIIQEAGLIENNKLIAAQQINVVAKTVIKTESEISLLNAKVTTEQKQIPMMDKQIELYEAQRVGFAQDAATKTLKIKADAWSVARSTDPDATPLPASLTP